MLAFTGVVLAVFVAFISVSHSRRTFCANEAVSCSTCCSHVPDENTGCCADNNTAPVNREADSAEEPVCCFSVHAENGTPSLPVRIGSESFTPATGMVSERLPLPRTGVASVRPLCASHNDGTDKLLVLCRLLI